MRDGSVHPDREFENTRTGRPVALAAVDTFATLPGTRRPAGGNGDIAAGAQRIEAR
jgi:hypothetical protein